MQYPKLRPVEILPVPGEDAVCLRDPLGFCPDPILLSRSSLHVLQFFDGEHSVRDIQTALVRMTGAMVFSDQIERLAQQLDQLQLLESDSFHRFREETIAQFRQDQVRAPSHAGLAYPEEPEALRQRLDSFFVDPKGPGQPAPRRGAHAVATNAVATNEVATNEVAAIMAPHIDLRHGGPCYAHAYRSLIEGGRATTFVILGVAHSGSEYPAVASRKAFRTPLGLMPADSDFIEELAGGLSFDLFQDEFAHRKEHSIEFQVLFLQHLLGDEARIVPILLGSFHHMLADGRQPEEDCHIDSFYRSLRRQLADRGDDVCVIVSVDLAHVGRRFGDRREVDLGFMAHVESEDREFLTAASNLDAAQVLAHIARDQDARRVDGFPGVYTLLNVMPLRSGTLLHYDRMADPQGQALVTYASMKFLR